MSTVADARLLIPAVLKVTVRAKACPWKIPVQAARGNLAGSAVRALSFGEGAGRDLPLTGIPATVPAKGCEGTAAAALSDWTECHVIVAVPEPVGNEGE